MNKAETKILEQLFRKVLAEKSSIRLAKFKDEYLSAISITHSASYNRTVGDSFTQLLKYTDNIPLLKIDAKTVEGFVSYTFKRSKYSAALYFRTLKAAFNKAVIWDYIAVNPFYKVKLPKIQKTKPAFINATQLEMIVSNSPDGLKEVFRFAFYTGLRLGELVNLQWSNVNLKERTIQIGDENFNTKSKSIRIVPLCDEAADILIKRVPKIFRKNKHCVFSKPSGFPFTGDYISKAFKKAVRKSGIDEKIHFHSLRHSFASNLVQRGASIYHLKNLLGHSSIAVTEIYSHLNIDSLRETVNKFNRVNTQ